MVGFALLFYSHLLLGSHLAAFAEAIIMRAREQFKRELRSSFQHMYGISVLITMP